MNIGEQKQYKKMSNDQNSPSNSKPPSSTGTGNAFRNVIGGGGNRSGNS